MTRYARRNTHSEVLGVSSSQGQRSDERRRVIEEARQDWINQLIDRSRRNNLLFYRTLKTGTLDLVQAGSSKIKEFIRGRTVYLTELLPPLEKREKESETSFREREARVRREAVAKLREIYRRALANFEEKGLETLFVAVGMATWPSDDGGTPYQAPVLLVPLRVRLRSQVDNQPRLERSGDVQFNPVLAREMEDRGCFIDEEELLEELNQEDPENGPNSGTRAQHVTSGDQDPVSRVLDRLRVEGERVLPDFSVIPRVVIGNFFFQKMAMVRDLELAQDLLIENDLIAALAGWREFENPGLRSTEDGPELLIDHIPPEDEYLVLDADSSQREAIRKILRGHSGVIQGPPGTGKSQTIANLIAELAARGRRILFVAEKRAALEAVYRRLEEVGLGHLALDLHGADISRRQIIERIGAALKEVYNSFPVQEETGIAKKLSQCRDYLNAHVRRLHQRRAPSGLGVYEMQGKLLTLPAEVENHIRWRGADLERLGGEQAQRIIDALKELGDLEEFFLGKAASPWTGAQFDTVEHVQDALNLASEIAYQTFPKLWEELNRWHQTAGVLIPESVEQLLEFGTLLERIEELLERYKPTLFGEDLSAAADALKSANRGLVRRLWASISSRSFRETRKRFQSYAVHKPPSVRQLLNDLLVAQELVEEWRSRATSSNPQLPYSPAHLKQLIMTLHRQLNELFNMFQRASWDTQSLVELEKRCRDLASDAVGPYRVHRVRTLVAELTSVGVGPLLDEIQRNPVDSRLWPAVFQYAWLRSCLDQARLEDPDLAAFQGTKHRRKVDEFRELDEKHIRLSVYRVRRLHAERVMRLMNEHEDQQWLIRREVNKKQRHLPIRKLLEKAPDVLLGLLPCWMVSPLSVSQVIGRENHYDVVIFDEASQIPPEDAVPAIMRARQVVAAGDRNQLPPTRFFADQSFSEEEEEEETANARQGFESLLTALSSILPNWPLLWHYRSRDERLIAFSSRYFYPNLVTFPGIGGDDVISHVLVEQHPGIDGQEESVSAEVEKVVELILEHARTRPNESLGVIAFGIKHARRIEQALDAALERALREEPELEKFFDTNKVERYFVKNLERVQGDERDAIILSVGYGKDRSGKLAYRFGPLLYEGGERRLNVAITRARKRMTVVSSFSHWDMDEGRSQAPGVVLLRSFLEFAASGGERLGERGPTESPMNEFEQDVYHALSAHGMSLVPQYGVSRYRLDFAVRHPRQPGRYVLAIECDGATYHDQPSARDRDRLRQQHLEALGWRFHRIWSTDWFMNRQAEIERALAAYRKALEECDRGIQPNDGDSPAAERELRIPKREPHLDRGERPPRPSVPLREKITEYYPHELDSLVRWVLSDGRPRTDQDIIEEMITELGFKRRGKRIEEAIRDSINRVRRAEQR